MDSMIWWILLMVVALIAGPFATVAAVSAFRTRRGAARAAAKPDKDDEDAGSSW